MLFGNDRYCRSFFLTVNCIFDLTAVSRVQPISTPYEANNQIVRFHADSIMDRTASRCDFFLAVLATAGHHPTRDAKGLVPKENGRSWSCERQTCGQIGRELSR